MWTGARRSRLILEELFKHSSNSSGSSKKRGFSEIGMGDLFRTDSRRIGPRQRMEGSIDIGRDGVMEAMNDMWTIDYGGFDILDPLSRHELFTDFL